MDGRRFSAGAECIGDGVAFRVFTDRRRDVRLVIEDGDTLQMRPDGDGYFSLTVRGAGPGTRYRFSLDGEGPFPDPASRFQPDGPHGVSQVVDGSGFRWTDHEWGGCRIAGQVIYEMHVGTFTPDGTWRAAADRLAHLADVGITLIEMMPVACFPGRFGWGYDGVALFAPTAQYGEPDDLRAFVDAAHAAGIGVILDVVYNHLGPAGNYLAQFSQSYFTDRYENDWGDALNFEAASGQAPMRDLVVENARYWIEDFHFDGLRLDATQSILDGSPDHVIAELTRVCREAAGSRDIVIVGENEPEDCRLVGRPEDGGYGLDALWNDDFHHSAVVAATARNEAYFEDHRGSPQEFLSAAKYGFLFQGQVYFHQRQRRGQPALDCASTSFVTFIENHDQVANSARGFRFHQRTSPGRLRALTALMLLMPGTPMLFQGQEFASRAPFLYFADHDGDLAEQVAEGRIEFLSQFETLASPTMAALVPRPDDAATFEACKLDWADARRNSETMRLHRDLISLRKTDAVIGAATPRVDGGVLAEESFYLRFFGRDGDARLLFVNFGRDLERRSIADPLLAPPRGRVWALRWSSEDPSYGGGGTAAVERPDGWRIPGQAAVLLSSEEPQ